MITLEETLYVNAQGQATVTLPPTIAPGAHRAVLQVEEAPLTGGVSRVAPKAGCLKGIWMAPDFDAPLEDFREYLG